MADAMLPKTKENDGKLSTPKPQSSKSVEGNKGPSGKGPMSGKKTSSKSSVASTSQSCSQGSTSMPSTGTGPDLNLVTFTQEMAGIMKEMRDNQNQLSQRVETIAERVDSLTYDDFGQYGPSYEPSQASDDDNCQQFSDKSQDDCSLSGYSQSQQVHDVAEQGLFKGLLNKFKQTEQVDNEVHGDLADFINESFRGGMSDEAYTSLSKDIHRPSNCTSLTKTTVNPQIWSYMKPWTQTADVKMQAIQVAVVKAAINFTKMMNKIANSVDSDILEFGSDALGILGHAHKLINVRRKEMHQADLDNRYKQLCSANVPFTDKLYGDDVCKNVKEIQDMNRVGKQLSVLSRFKGSRRGRPYPSGPYGNFRGRGRGRGGRYQPLTSSYTQAPKNPKMGVGKR